MENKYQELVEDECNDILVNNSAHKFWQEGYDAARTECRECINITCMTQDGCCSKDDR